MKNRLETREASSDGQQGTVDRQTAVREIRAGAASRRPYRQPNRWSWRRSYRQPDGQPRAQPRPWWHAGPELGMATAEYAIATLAAVGFAGLLVVILKSDEVRGFLLGIIRSALSLP
jgi:uncharacterized protein DUF4244